MEYANINIFELKKGQRINEKRIKQEINEYKKTGKLSSILVDNDYNIVKNAEAYWAGKRLGLKYLESSRVKSKIKPDSKFPPAFLLELTNKCNLFCRMCPLESFPFGLAYVAKYLINAKKLSRSVMQAITKHLNKAVFEKSSAGDALY